MDFPNKSDATGLACAVAGLFGGLAVAMIPWDASLWLKHILFWLSMTLCVFAVVWLIHLRLLSGLKRRHRWAVSLSSISAFIVLMAVIEIRYSAAQQLASLPPQENLTASFTFGKTGLIGRGDFEVDYALRNSGQKPTLIESIGVVEVVNYYDFLNSATYSHLGKECLDKQLSALAVFKGIEDLYRHPYAMHEQYIAPETIYIGMSGVETTSY